MAIKKFDVNTITKPIMEWAYGVRNDTTLTEKEKEETLCKFCNAFNNAWYYPLCRGNKQ